MPQVSFPTVVGFLALVLAVAAGFVYAAGRASRVPSKGKVRSDRWIALAIVLLWLGPAAFLSAGGYLIDFGSQAPPPLLRLVGATTVGTTLVAFSRVGSRLIPRMGLAWLVGFQVFRFPLELVLHRLYVEGALPVQMTYSGLNFDILTGLSAGVLGLWAARGAPPRWVFWAWNLMGLALLVTIVTIAIMSMPGPTRVYANEPANRIVATFPLVWLPTFLVQAAWFGHLLMFRRLLGAARPE